MELSRSARPTRRGLLRAGGGLLAAATRCRASPVADDQPPIGTWPAGSSGSSVFIGITVPRTGTYAVQGEDELKGLQLAVEHINSGDPLIKMISPKTTKGVLGKEVKYGVADSEAKPNTAVQEQSRFISENKAVLMTGSTSSAVAVALNKFAQREKVLYVAGISGSNDTTGKDCVALRLPPVLLRPDRRRGARPGADQGARQEQKGRLSDAGLHLWPHRPAVDGGLPHKNGGWTTVTNQVAPLGAPDYSSYLLNIANSGAEVLLNINWGHDAVLSIAAGAAVRHPAPSMKLVIPYQIPFLAKEVGPQIMAGRLCRHRFLVDARGQVSAGQDVRRPRSTRNTATSRNGAPTTPICSSRCGRTRCERAGTFYPPDGDQGLRGGQARSNRPSARFISAPPIISWCAR